MHAQVQVVPLPPPSLEPPKVPLRVPKAVRERQEAAAAAAAAKEAAASAQNGAPASVAAAPGDKETIPDDDLPRHPGSSKAAAALVPRGSAGEEGVKGGDDMEQGNKKSEGRLSGRGRSPSLSPARSLDRSPPARKA